MLKTQFKDGRSEPVLLAAPGQTIGRGIINDIVIDVDGVGGFHADLKVEGKTVTLSGVDTKTGTQLNGDYLSGPTTLRAGDVIKIQGVELEVFEEENEQVARTLVLSGTVLMGMVPNGWSLIANSGPEKGQQIPINQKTEIGRALDCDISILEPALSRKHAEIEPLNGELTLKDLGSANGTYVNAKKIKEVRLKDRDILQFNKVSFIVKAP
jgi:pSer/pThr/pTyr-binding forkhead associated (FHA) protein